MNLEGKVVAITGAYSGLGAALSEALAKKGCKLVLGGREKEKLGIFAEKIPTAVPVLVDVRKMEDCEHFISESVKKFGRLDIMINNAGILSRFSNIEEVTEEELLDAFRTNLFGTIFCTQAAVRRMKNQGGGTIVNIGSTSAVDYKSSHIAYGTSKCAVVGLTGMLNKELNGTGIRAFCFSPGGMKTHLFRNQPERNTGGYMEPSVVSEKIIECLENPPEDWHIVLRRPK